MTITDERVNLDVDRRIEAKHFDDAGNVRADGPTTSEPLSVERRYKPFACVGCGATVAEPEQTHAYIGFGTRDLCEKCAQAAHDEADQAEAGEEPAANHTSAGAPQSAATQAPQPAPAPSSPASSTQVLGFTERAICTACGHVCRVMVWHRGHDHLCYACIEAYDRRARSGDSEAKPRQRRGANLPAPGTVLRARYKGADYEATVTAAGIEYGGQVYRTLSAAAHAITLGPISGPIFWRVGGDT